VGIGAERIRNLFKMAKKEANPGCIIFIDEIDSIAVKRSELRYPSTGVGQLLVEMDGFKNSDGVIVFAATNRIEDIEPALLRSGRFDRLVHVRLPLGPEREEVSLVS